MVSWKNVKLLECVVLYYLLCVSHGKCRQAVTINHAEAEFKQALRILETGEDSGCDPSVEGEPPQDMWQRAENSRSTIKFVTAVVIEPSASK